MKLYIILALALNISTLNAATISKIDFESGKINGLSCSGNCPKASKAQKKSGKYSGNFTLTRNMRTPFRTEAVLDKGRSRFQFGKEYWVSFDYRYEDWVKDKSSETSPFQIHTAPGKWDKKCYIASSGRATSPLLMSSKNGVAQLTAYHGKVLWKGPVQTKKWLNITFHLKISHGNDGFIEAWKDGVKLGRINGPNSPKTDRCGLNFKPPYLKFGVYKWDWKKGRKATGSKRRQLFIDNLIIESGSNKNIKITKTNNKAKKQPNNSKKKKVKVSKKNKVTVLKITKNKSKAKNKKKQIKYVNEKNLLAYWSMDGNGNTVVDASGNGHTGFLKKGAKKVNGGIRYDGKDDYLDLGKFNLYGNKMTISGWFNSDNLNNCKHRDCRILSKSNGVNGKDHYWMVSTVSVGSKTRLRFRLKTNGKTHTLVATSGNLKNNKWVHFAAVYNGHAMFLFKDGKQVGAMKKTGNITRSKAKVWIGGSPVKPSLRPWKGRIDEVRIYNNALSKAQIVNLANE